MDKPNTPYSSSPTSTPQFMPINIADPSIRGEAWDQLLRNRGIRFIHKKAALCPNIKSPDLRSHEPDCQFCDSSGIIYYSEKEIWGVFTSNTLEKLFEVQGVWEMGSAVVSFPTEYPDGTQADFNTFDLLTCPDFQIRLPQLKEYELTSDNKQKLRYPVLRVEYASSITNGEMKLYEQGVDFNVVDGKIEWVEGKQPPINSASQVGDTVTWDYIASPVYRVLQHMHEIRASQQMDNGQKTARRLPQAILVKRDFMVQLNEKIDGT